jgi:hypothetical protein
MGHVVNPNATLSLPDLGNFKTDAETVLSGLDKVLTFIDTYGAYIPGVNAYTATTLELDKFVRGALKLLEA